jgi:hypothetical protein
LEDTTIENALKTFEDFYLKKDFVNAQKILQNSQSTIEPGLWNYNMGVLQVELNNPALARLYFLRAEKYGFQDSRLQQNKSLIESQLEISKLEKPINSSDWFIKGSLIAAEGPLITMGLLILVISLWALKKSLTFKRFFLSLALVSLPFILNWWISNWPQKLVSVPMPIYEGPSALFSIRGELPTGVILVTNKKGEWEEIIYPARFHGWIKSEGLFSLESK